MIHCRSCDKEISQKFIKKHNKSKSHLYFLNNFVIKKYHIGDVLWKDFENIINDYINEYNNKFNSFSIKIDFQLNNENNTISIDNVEGEIPLYNFKNIGWIYYKFSQSKKSKRLCISYSYFKKYKIRTIIDNK